MGFPAAGLRDHAGKPGRDDAGGLGLQGGRDDPGHGNRKIRPRQIEAVGLDSRAPPAAARSTAMRLCGSVASIDTCSARPAPDATMRIRWRRPPWRAADGCDRLALSAASPRSRRLALDHRIGQLDLAHFQNGGSHRPPEASAGPASPNAKPKPSLRHDSAATAGIPLSVVMSSSQLRRRVEVARREANAAALACFDVDAAAEPRARAGRRATTGWPHRARSVRASRAGRRLPRRCRRPNRCSTETAA